MCIGQSNVERIPAIADHKSNVAVVAAGELMNDEQAQRPGSSGSMRPNIYREMDVPVFSSETADGASS